MSSKESGLESPNLVSVVVPAYNAEETIKACLDSLLNQSYHDIEVIVVDDGSIDKTRAIASGYPVTVIDIPHSGASRARNVGFAASKGDIIVFAEADGMYDHEYIRNVLKYFQDPSVGGVLDAHFPIPSDSFSSKYMDALCRIRTDDYVQGRIEPVTPHIFRREAFIRVRGYDETLTTAEETDIGLRLKQIGYKIAYASDAFFWHGEPTLPELARRAFCSGYSKVYYKSFKAGGFGRVKTPIYKKYKQIIPWKRIGLAISFAILAIMSFISIMFLHLFVFLALTTIFLDLLILLRRGWAVVEKKIYIVPGPFILILRNVFFLTGVLAGCLSLFLHKLKIVH